MKVNLDKDEIDLMLNSIGLVLNIVQDQQARGKLEALQAKLMAIRDA